MARRRAARSYAPPIRLRHRAFRELYFAAGKYGDGNPVAVEKAIARQCRELWAGGNNAYKIERIGSGNGKPLA